VLRLTLTTANAGRSAGSAAAAAPRNAPKISASGRRALLTAVTGPIDGVEDQVAEPGCGEKNGDRARRDVLPADELDDPEASSQTHEEDAPTQGRTPARPGVSRLLREQRLHRRVWRRIRDDEPVSRSGVDDDLDRVDDSQDEEHQEAAGKDDVAHVIREPRPPRPVADGPRAVAATDRPAAVSLVKMEDRALVDAVLARAPGAFERLIREYQGLCWHVINRMVRDPEDTRDLCQDTFLRVHRHLRQYRFESPLKSWIGQIAYSVAVRHLQRKRIPLVDADTDGPRVVEQIASAFDLEAANAQDEIVVALRAEIEALPPVPRMLLTLYYLDEMPIGEIARVTNLAEGTIKSHLFRSRARLRERLTARLGGHR